MFTGRLVCAVAGALPLAVASAALGTGTPVTATLVQVQATSGDHSASFSEVFPVSSFEQYSWSLPAPLTLSDDGVSLGTLDSLDLFFDADPQVDLFFSYTNTNQGSPIVVNVSTATIAFSPLVNPDGATSASLTLTQGAGSTPGASLTGLFPGGNAYQARYSTDGIINTQTVFATLASSMSFPSGLAASNTESSPAVGMTVIPGTVHMLEAEFWFELSAGDQASGTSTFLIAPEPATLAALFLGGAGCLFRRNRRKLA